VLPLRLISPGFVRDAQVACEVLQRAGERNFRSVIFAFCKYKVPNALGHARKRQPFDPRPRKP
jgi:hypothetical protein